MEALRGGVPAPKSHSLSGTQLRARALGLSLGRPHLSLDILTSESGNAPVLVYEVRYPLGHGF